MKPKNLLNANIFSSLSLTITFTRAKERECKLFSMSEKQALVRSALLNQFNLKDNGEGFERKFEIF